MDRYRKRDQFRSRSLGSQDLFAQNLTYTDGSGQYLTTTGSTNTATWSQPIATSYTMSSALNMK